MKKNKIIISFLIMCLVLLASLLIYQQKEILNLKSDIESLIALDNQDTDIIIDDFSIPIEDIDCLLNDEIIGVIYFGRDTCPFCSELNLILKNFSNIKIYKFDTDKWRDNDNFQIILDKYNIDNVPALIKIGTDKTTSYFAFDENSTDEEIISALYEFLK